VLAALHADDTALVATSHSPSLLVGYLEAYLGGLERWLRDWRIAINVSKTTVCFLLRLRDASKNPVQSSIFGKPVQWVEPVRYLEVTLDTQLTWPAHVNQVGRKAAKIRRAWPTP
jgi:hypothetical protein